MKRSRNIDNQVNENEIYYPEWRDMNPSVSKKSRTDTKSTTDRVYGMENNVPTLPVWSGTQAFENWLEHSKVLDQGCYIRNEESQIVDYIPSIVLSLVHSSIQTYEQNED